MESLQITSTVHRCVYDGVVVGATRPIGTTPYDYAWPGNRLGLGCGRLQCTRCGEMVSQWTGALPTQPIGPAVLARLKGAASLQPFVDEGLFTASSDARTYACACTSHAEFHGRGIREGEEAWEMASRPPWRCAGHPRLVPPDALDDLEITDGMDVDALVEHELSAVRDHGMWTDGWLSRLWHVLEPSPLADRLDQAIARRLADRRPEVVLRAIDFYDRNPTAPGVVALMDVIRHHPERLQGVANPFPAGGDLWQWALQALAGRLVVKPDKDVIDLAERCIADGPVPPVLRIAMNDPDDPRVAAVWAS